MNAYVNADRIDQERQEQMRLDDLRIEAAINDAFSNSETLAQAMADWNEDSIALNRFAQSIFTLYLDTESMTPNVMRFRGALYALVKTRCREQIAHE